MGKGLISANPFHSDRLLMSGVGLGAILILLHSCLDMKKTLLGQLHYILYHVVSAMNPRMLLTVDEDMQLLPVSVRVGQAVETVGQAGRPKTITGFQTHTTPCVLGARDRAELAAGEYLPAISARRRHRHQRKNPDWKARIAIDSARAAPPGITRSGRPLCFLEPGPPPAPRSDGAWATLPPRSRACTTPCRVRRPRRHRAEDARQDGELFAQSRRNGGLGPATKAPFRFCRHSDRLVGGSKHF